MTAHLAATVSCERAPMARIEWVKLRLNNWALWKHREATGGLGYASQAAFLNEPSGGYRESIIPVDDVDAAVTNSAVESLRDKRYQLYETLQCIYPRGLGIKETARRCGLAESTIKAHLDQADHALAEWFRERAESKRSFTP